MATTRTALRRLDAWVPGYVHAVLAELRRRGARAVLVGGGVRDAFLGRKAPDWDVATDARPDQVAGWFERVVRAGEKHGTIMVLTGGGPVEVTTFRGEGPYLDGRRPSEVYFLEDLEADLARRDLTINAMAVDLAARTVVDPFGGLADLRAGLIRCVGDAQARFSEDGLRPLRAVRFAATLDFRLHHATRRALGSHRGSFELVAWERKRDELERMLSRAVALVAPVAALEQAGLLRSLAPELVGTRRATLKAIERMPLGAPWLRLAAWAAARGVDSAAAGELMRRWRCSRNDVTRVERWLQAFSELPARRAPEGAELRRWLARNGEDVAPSGALLAQALRGTPYARFPLVVRRAVDRRLPLTLDRLAVNSRDLLARGWQGRALGQVLAELLRVVVEDPKKNTAGHLLALADRLSTARVTPANLL